MDSEKNTEQKIKILIKTLDNQQEELIISNYERVEQLMQRIEQLFRIPETRQRLLYQGQLLRKDKQLYEYCLKECSIVQLIAYSNKKEGININKKTSNSASNSSLSNQSNQTNQFMMNNINNNIGGQQLNKEQQKIQQQRVNGFEINLPQAYEVLSQNMMNIKKMLKSQIYLNDLRSQEETLNVFNMKESAEVGQWVDVRDQKEQWVEGVIGDKQDTRVNIIYINQNEPSHEWIDSRSSRLAIYRTHTLSTDIHTNYLSPFPSHLINNPNPTHSININNSYQSLKEIANDTAHSLNQISNLLFKLVKTEEQKQINVFPKSQKEPSKGGNKVQNNINCTFKEASQINCVISEHTSQIENDKLSVHSLKSQSKQEMYEQETISMNSQSVNANDMKCTSDELSNYLLASQLAPLMDRCGRFMVDLSKHFALYGSNIQHILPQFNNYHNTSTLSIATNEGSQQDYSSLYRVNQLLHQQNQQPSQLQQKKSYFQVPVLLTPQEILALAQPRHQTTRVHDTQSSIDIIVQTQLFTENQILNNPYLNRNRNLPSNKEESVSNGSACIDEIKVDQNHNVQIQNLQNLSKYDDKSESISSHSENIMKKSNIKQENNEINKHVTFDSQYETNNKKIHNNQKIQIKNINENENNEQIRVKKNSKNNQSIWPQKKNKNLFMNKLAQNKDDRESSTNKSIHSEKSDRKYYHLPKHKIKINLPGVDKIDDDFENDEHYDDFEQESLSKYYIKKHVFQEIIEEPNDYNKKEED